MRVATESAARGICRLCRQERQLHDSHIVTEYLYKPPYDGRRKISGFDYPSFKLFLLSILWRAGVSSRGESQPGQLPANH